MKAPLFAWRTAGLLGMAVSSMLLCASAWAQAPDAGQRDTVEATRPEHAVLARGRATWYGAKFHGRRTSNGERFDMNSFTAAHEWLPFGTKLRVRNVANGREVVVRINDRAPHLRNRIIDLSKAAAAALGFVKAGAATVVLSELAPQPQP